MKKRLQVRVYGRVQGVWFRASTKRKAEELNLVGFVRNEPDSSVYMEIEGDEAALAAMVEWCKMGPQFAKVEEVKMVETNLLDEMEFIIQR